MRVEVERLVLRHMTANSYTMVKKTYHITTKQQQQQQKKKGWVTLNKKELFLPVLSFCKPVYAFPWTSLVFFFFFFFFSPKLNSAMCVK